MFGRSRVCGCLCAWVDSGIFGAFCFDCDATFKIAIQGQEQAPSGLDRSGPKRQFRYREEKCAASFPVYIGEDGAPTGAELIQRFSPEMSAHLVVQFAASQKLPTELVGSSDYITTTTNPAWQKHFPMLISKGELQDADQLIKEGWRGDAVACLISDRSKPHLLSHLITHAASFSSVDGRRASHSA